LFVEDTFTHGRGIRTTHCDRTVEIASALARRECENLPAALVAADRDPTTLELVFLDARLTTAARREGFRVIDA
jgi:hypothetical protein